MPTFIELTSRDLVGFSVEWGREGQKVLAYESYLPFHTGLDDAIAHLGALTGESTGDARSATRAGTNAAKAVISWLVEDHKHSP